MKGTTSNPLRELRRLISFFLPLFPFSLSLSSFLISRCRQGGGVGYYALI